MILLDTSVLIAVAQVSHEHHRASRKLWNRCARKNSAVSVHTLAELYSALTSMPPALRLRPRDAVLAVETFLLRLTPIDLAAEEYLETFRRAATAGFSGGIVYDALHLSCARKCGAKQIYTLNLRHFRAVAPDLAARIVSP
ncbi:MAG: PIN domain-containing protein [Acidobacteriaceae bacterium]